jgi:hypothetical protein
LELIQNGFKTIGYMKDKLIEFKTAKLANEKGCFENSDNKWFEDEMQWLQVPTQSLLQRWLREVHLIDVVISPERYKDGVNYLVQAQKWDLKSDPEVNVNFVIQGSYWFNDNGEYLFYEDALEKGLQEALTFIK